MRMLMAIDDSAYSQAAVDAVIAQFGRDGTEVRVLNVIEWPRELSASLVFTPGAMAAGPVMDLREDARRQSEELLARAAEQLRAAGFSASYEMREGDARHVILECAAEWRPAVIVVGSHGRTGVDRFLLGSVSPGTSCVTPRARWPSSAEPVDASREGVESGRSARKTVRALRTAVRPLKKAVRPPKKAVRPPKKAVIPLKKTVRPRRKGVRVPRFTV